MSSITLTDDEIFDITRYRRGAEQLRVLKELGIRAQRRRDNSVCVLRADAIQPGEKEPARVPKLKLTRR